jgi:superfamily II DNA or RNA helicase
MLHLKINNSKVEIVTGDSDLLKKCKSLLKIFYVDGRDKTKLHSIYVGRGNFFPTGFLSQFEKKAKRKKIEYTVEDLRSDAVKHHSFTFNPMLSPRQHQIDCMKAIGSNNVGIVSSPTGSGKSFMIASTIAEKNTPTLVIVPTTLVRDSLAESFKLWFGAKAVSTEVPVKPWAPKPKEESEELSGEVSSPDDDADLFPFLTKKKKKSKTSGNPFERMKIQQYEAVQRKIARGNWFKPITILCYNSLPQLPREYVRSVGCVIIDECHTASVEAIRDCLFNAEEAIYRYGFSATPWRDQNHMLKLMQSALGAEIIFDYAPEDAIDEGMIAKPNLNIIQSEFPETFLKKVKDFRRIVDEGIIRNKARNMQIVKKAIELCADNHQVFIAVNEISQFEGKMIVVSEDEFGNREYERELDISYSLSSLFRDRGQEVFTIFGDDTSKEKMKQMKELREMECGFILIGTMAFGLGADVPGIDKVIMAGGGKSSINFLQRLGRGTRTTEDEDKQLEVFDFMDRWNMTAKNHSIERVKIFTKYYKGCKVYGF